MFRSMVECLCIWLDLMIKYVFIVAASIFFACSITVSALSMDRRTYDNCYVSNAMSWFGYTAYCPGYENNNWIVVWKSNCWSNGCDKKDIKLDVDSYVVIEKVYATDWDYFYSSWKRTTRKEFVKIVWSDEEIPSGSFFFQLWQLLIQYYKYILFFIFWCILFCYRIKIDSHFRMPELNKSEIFSTILNKCSTFIAKINANRLLTLMILILLYQISGYELLDFFYAQILFWIVVWFFVPLSSNKQWVSTTTVVRLYLFFNLLFVSLHVFWDWSSDKWSAWWRAMILGTAFTLLTSLSIWVGYVGWKVIQSFIDTFWKNPPENDTSK
jgi:hypothetical protein